MKSEKKSMVVWYIVLAALLWSAMAMAEEKTAGPEAGKKETEKEKINRSGYPLKTCVVTGLELGSMGDSIIHQYEKREVRFCCAGCIPKFEEAPEKYLAKLDEALVAQQMRDYPLDRCVVAGGKLGGPMGRPIDFLHEGRLVRFCCRGCEKEFQKEPVKYLKKLDEAVIEKQKPVYPLAVCVVSGEELGSMGEPVDYVYRNRLVRFCCPACVGKFEKNSGEYLKQLDEAEALRKREKGVSLAPEVPTGADPATTSTHGRHDHGTHE